MPNFMLVSQNERLFPLFPLLLPRPAHHHMHLLPLGEMVVEVGGLMAVLLDLVEVNVVVALVLERRGRAGGAESRSRSRFTLHFPSLLYSERQGYRFTFIKFSFGQSCNPLLFFCVPLFHFLF